MTDALLNENICDMQSIQHEVLLSVCSVCKIVS